ncbi:thiolase family protein [Pseudonocardia sp. H11422]|uniref:thiolase family protein n=1 Tax=Pseudonocardia sp. H11422 TaxID=2835866 RepID=UPI001BDD18B4|nr:thiolase family protein [Pseudonocardia sp. H11422]
MLSASGPAIVGIGEELTRDAGGRSGLELQAGAVRAAVADAGLSLTDVDAVYALPPYSDAHSMFALSLAEHLGVRGSAAVTVDVGGTVSPIIMLLQAALAIRHGAHGTAVCVFGEAARTGRRHTGTGWTLSAAMGTEEFEEPFGAVGFVVPYALLASRYLYEYGAPRSAFAAVAMSARRHAALHPLALMRDRPMTAQDYDDAPMVSDPLCLLDCSVIADGAGALVVCAADRARDLIHPPIALAGVGTSVTHKNVNQLPPLSALGMRDAADKAYRAGGLTAADIDVALVHDAFTVSTLLTVEGLGLCGAGEGADYARDGGLDLGGPCPVNPHGGLLSQGHLGGILHLTEAVVQLRGAAGPRQVPGARVAAVAGNGAVFGTCGVLLLSGTDR